MEGIVIIILAITVIFLSKEFLKKGRFLRGFVNRSSQMVQWDYIGALDSKPQMRNIVLSASVPFSVLVGFELKILGYTGYDPYGYIASNEQNQVVISTYLGRKSVNFQFLINTSEAEVHISSTAEEQNLVPMKIFPPHWWQRFGFYG